MGPVRPRSEQIERVETYALSVPLVRPIADSHAQLTHWVIPVVEISTRDGLTGTGYSGLHTGAELLLQTIDGYFAPLVIGRSAAERGAIWQAMYTSPIQWVGRAGVVHMALGMVDIALWDVAAQRAGVPLWELLGGHHSEVAAYNTDGGWLNRRVEELIEDMVAMVDEGWFGVKMKLGKPSWREDVDRLTTVRSALGPDVWLAVDVNKQWDLTTALRILPVLEECQIAWIEEPFHPDDVFLHRKFQALTRIPVAVGESLYSRHAFQLFFELEGLRVAQIDVTRVGGITEYLEIAAAARAASVPVVPHAGDMVQIQQHLVAAAFDASPPLLEYLPWTSEIYETPVDVKAGKVVLPTVPGATTAVLPEARAKFAISGIGSLTR